MERETYYLYQIINYSDELIEENDRRITEEEQELSSVEKTAEEIEHSLIIEYWITLIVISRHVREKPCQSEMELFSKCLRDGEDCNAFEESYFKCIDELQ